MPKRRLRESDFEKRRTDCYGTLELSLGLTEGCFHPMWGLFERQGGATMKYDVIVIGSGKKG